MRPPIARALRASWLAFGGTAVVCAAFLAWWSDWGAAGERARAARAAYQDRIGSLDLAEQVRKQTAANHELRAHIGERKEQTGVREVLPFTVPADFDKEPKEYFRVAYSRIRDDLLFRASRRGSAGYDQDLGFGFLQGGLPESERVEGWLLMLQLTSKAAYLALHAPHNTLENIAIADLGSSFAPTTAGPEDRPPLLREYRFQLSVDGSLHDILWLLHQLSAETQTDAHRQMQEWLSGDDGVADKVYQALYGSRADAPAGEAIVSPLVVLGLRIASRNVEPDQAVQTLSARFDLAGMEFMDAAERGDGAGGADAAARISGRGARANRP